MTTVASHLSALRELLVGVEMDAAHDPSGPAKIAALQAAITALASPAGEGADLNTAAVEAGHITWRSMKQCADAWLAVAALLHELVPDWTNNSLTACEAALAAIRRLASSVAQGEAVELTKCCGREECGGECGNEWRGTEWVRKATPPPAPAAVGVDEATSRRAFETWWRATGSTFELTPDPNWPRGYAISQVQCAWQAWTAALAGTMRDELPAR